MGEDLSRFGAIDVSSEDRQREFDQLPDDKQEVYITQQQTVATDFHQDIRLDVDYQMRQAELSEILDVNEAESIRKGIHSMAEEKLQQAVGAEQEKWIRLIGKLKYGTQRLLDKNLGQKSRSSA
jgi:hypothetical protein